MKFKGSFVTSASGSIAGITASRNRGGQYIRARLIPTDPAAALQMVVRGIFGAVTARWLADLSEAERDAWDLYASNTPMIDALGDTIFLSGHQQFVRTNVAALQAGQTQFDVAPTVYGTGQLAELGTPAATGATVSVAITSMPANSTAILFAGRPQNASVSHFRGPWRFVDVSATSPVAGTQPFPVAPGNRQWVGVRLLNDDGRLSGLVLGGPVIQTIAV
jgi:hypothetical protein